MANEYIELNLIPTGEKPVFHAAQYDVGRPIIIKLKNGEDDFTPNDLDIELQVRKVDNNIVTAVPVSVDGNVVTFLSTQQMTACSGTNLCEVELSDSSITIATLHFYLVVQRDVLAGGLTSQSEIYDIEEQIAAIVPEVIGDEYYTAEEVDEKIAEIPTFDPSNYYDKTQLYTKTETNGLLSQKANTTALSTVAFSGDYDDLLNKPTFPDVSNYYTKSETYNQTEVNNLLSTKADTSSLSTVATTGDYDDLLNKPTIPTDATELPISSSDPTNTKNYIDTGLSGKADNTIDHIGTDEASILGRAMSVGDTFQVPSKILNHKIVTVMARRAGKISSITLTTSDLLTSGNTLLMWEESSNWWHFQCSNTGVFKLFAKSSGADDPYVFMDAYF